MNVSSLTQHLLISLAPWLFAVITAGGLGRVCALAVRSLFSRYPIWRRPSLLLPWRTVVLTLPLLSPWIATRVGLGALAAGIVVGLFVFLLALPVTVAIGLEKWYPTPSAARFVAVIRTLAAASVAVAAVAAPAVGGGGAGSLIIEGMRALDYAEVFRGFAVVVVLALTMDLVLGTLQLVLLSGEQ
jgi:hypothetical protein